MPSMQLHNAYPKSPGSSSKTALWSKINDELCQPRLIEYQSAVIITENRQNIAETTARHWSCWVPIKVIVANCKIKHNKGDDVSSIQLLACATPAEGLIPGVWEVLHVRKPPADNHTHGTIQETEEIQTDINSTISVVVIVCYASHQLISCICNGNELNDGKQH